MSLDDTIPTIEIVHDNDDMKEIVKIQQKVAFFSEFIRSAYDYNIRNKIDAPINLPVDDEEWNFIIKYFRFYEEKGYDKETPGLRWLMSYDKDKDYKTTFTCRWEENPLLIDEASLFQQFCDIKIDEKMNHQELYDFLDMVLKFREMSMRLVFPVLKDDPNPAQREYGLTQKFNMIISYLLKRAVDANIISENDMKIQEKIHEIVKDTKDNTRTEVKDLTDEEYDIFCSKFENIWLKKVTTEKIF